MERFLCKSDSSESNPRSPFWGLMLNKSKVAFSMLGKIGKTLGYLGLLGLTCLFNYGESTVIKIKRFVYHPRFSFVLKPICEIMFVFCIMTSFSSFATQDYLEHQKEPCGNNKKIVSAGIISAETEKSDTSFEETKMKSNEEIAQEVILGLWGEGEERYKRLNSKGYNSDEIQALVDSLMPKVETTKSNKTTYSSHEISKQVWDLMKGYGWSDTVCAGILGNLMAETGGHTFNLNPNSDGNSGLGLCQWIGSRRQSLIRIYGASCPSVEEQIEFMKNEIFGYNGVSCQMSDASRTKLFCSATPEEAALTFAKYFERCNSKYYNCRAVNAREAYNHFAI